MLPRAGNVGVSATPLGGLVHLRSCATRGADPVSVLAPFGLVKVHGEKVAGIVSQERVDADRLLAGKVALDDRVRYRYQQTIAAISALDARLLADTGTPLVGTRRGVA